VARKRAAVKGVDRIQLERVGVRDARFFIAARVT
jgi:hypothetical protein